MNTREDMNVQEEAQRVSAAEISAQELGAQMAQTAVEEDDAAADAQAQQQEEMLAQVREGISELFADGWTAEELAAFSQDPAAQEAIAGGHSVARAACAYLRAKQAHIRRHGVPTARTIAASSLRQDNPIESMTDEQFDAFSKRAQAAMLEGRKVRI